MKGRLIRQMGGWIKFEIKNVSEGVSGLDFKIIIFFTDLAAIVSGHEIATVFL